MFHGIRKEHIRFIPMIPLSDIDRTPIRFPVVTALIIALNSFVFLLELMGGSAFIRQWSIIPAHIITGDRMVTVFTAMFMHGSWMHIIGNMVYLWAFGPEIEDVMGKVRYAIFYLSGGVIASLAQVIIAPGSTAPNLGASGAIATVMGAFIITFPHDKIRTLVLIGWYVTVSFIPSILLIGFWFLIQLFSEFGSVMQQTSGGVAYMAHIGGFIFGIITARFFEYRSRLYRPEA